ncbi:hypothetical protein CFC21_084397 [Triticum aestivum]|uniref:MACPF domain-containing protein n=2 Tax=Triticum aestivum TaxID=4565 RepID=A0A9R1IAN2_WHEAT|nr:uncharacterized protein LOC123128328 isoform X2 [Triticum aestivum]KAF7080295.1 hypothetical protein CFC21_084397 [Triticum aestivum]
MAVATAAEKAVRCLGLGFDMTCDLRLKFCKHSGGCVVARSSRETAPAAVPGVGVVRDMPADVKCGKGDRVRFKSDALEFNKMSELFNQRSAVEGKIPSGQFNACFDLDSGSWAQDASATKCLAMDGYFISLFDLQLDRRPLALAAHVLCDVPAAWDPSAIASFIEKYGTHVVVGLSMGGQDVVCVRQAASSPLSPAEIRGHLDRLGDQLFTGACAVPPPHARSRARLARTPEAFNVFDAQVAQQRLQGITTLVSSKEGVTVIYSKRGGNTTVSSHAEWLPTVPAAPDVINAKLVPITSLLRGVAGTGFLSHAINLYLRSSQNVGPGARRAAPRPLLRPPGLRPGPALQPARLQALRQLQPGDRVEFAGHRDEAAPRGQEEQPAGHPPAAPVGHPDVHRRRAGAGRHGAGVAGLRGGHRRPPLLRAGAVADVRARLHRAGQVRPAVAPLPLRRRRRPPRRLHRDRRAAARHGARLHHRAAPPAALLGAARLRRRAVQVGARPGEDGVGEVAVVVELPVHALLGVLFVVVVRWRWRPEAARPAAGGGEHQLRRVRRRAARARGRAEAAQVRGHLAGDHGPARQPRVLARHRREARRRQGQDLAARQVLPARPVAFLTVTESVQFS